MDKTLSEEERKVAYWQFKADCYAKDIVKLAEDLVAAQQEICTFMCDVERNKDGVLMLPEEYAEFRGWHCYDKPKLKTFVYDPTVRIFEELKAIKEAIDALKGEKADQG